MKLILTSRQQELFRYIKDAHGDQKRKYTGEPYWHHLLTVAEILNSYGHDDLIEIALCHDVIEDVESFTSEDLEKLLSKCGYSKLESNFIVDGVVSLTDTFTSELFPNHNRVKRKELECKRLSHISPLFQIVKCADLMDNTISIVEQDESFARVYLKEKEQILINFFLLDSYKIYADCMNQVIEKQIV